MEKNEEHDVLPSPCKMSGPEDAGIPLHQVWETFSEEARRDIISQIAEILCQLTQARQEQGLILEEHGHPVEQRHVDPS